MEYCITVTKKRTFTIKDPQLLFAHKIKYLSAKNSSQFHLHHKSNVLLSNIKKDRLLDTTTQK